MPLLPPRSPGPVSRRRRLRAAAAAGAGILLLARPASLPRAQGAGAPPAAAEPRSAGRARLRAGPHDGFPDPFWLSLLTAVAGGVAGAAAAERLAGRRRARAGHEPGGAALETLVVGSVAAVALVSLNPPGGAWWALAGTAAAAGGGAQALLLAVAHSRRALAAEQARAAAEDAARRTAVLAGEQIETLRRLAVDPAAATADRAAWERALDVYAERARAELRAAAPRPARPAPAAAEGDP